MFIIIGLVHIGGAMLRMMKSESKVCSSSHLISLRVIHYFGFNRDIETFYQTFFNLKRI